MKLDVKYWNPYVKFHRMGRFRKKEIMALKPGDIAYYINTGDDLIGVVYQITVKEKYEHILTMECFPIIDTMPDGPVIADYIKPHIESYAYNDACEDSNQILFKDFIM